MSAKDKKEKAPEPRTGSVSADDNELMTWLHSFFHKGEPPEKLDVWQATGPNKDVRGANLLHEDWKGNATLNPEECALLANKILSTAQYDCNTIQKKSWYIIDVLDRHRMSEPTTRKIGPLFPKVTHLPKQGQGGVQEEDDDEAELVLGGKPMALQYIDRLIAVLERKEQALNAITGDIMLHQSRENAELRAVHHRLMESNMQMFFAIQDALDRKEDREDRRKDRIVARARDELIADGLREGGRMVRNLLPGVVDAFSDGGPAQQPQPPPAPPAKRSGPPTLPDCGPSRERYLCENFLSDIAAVKPPSPTAPRLDEQLFGDWIEEGESGLRPNPERPGIFTPDQVRILVGVAQGRLPPSRLDELDPDGGHANAITGEQLGRAQPLIPGSAMIAVYELLGLRAQKRAAEKNAATTQEVV